MSLGPIDLMRGDTDRNGDCGDKPAPDLAVVASRHGFYLLIVRNGSRFLSEDPSFAHALSGNPGDSGSVKPRLKAFGVTS